VYGIVYGIMPAQQDSSRTAAGQTIAEQGTTWSALPTAPRYLPLNYLSHLLGHEGEGSAFAALRKRGLATSLVAGKSGNSLSFR
jgi:hypothetical protein